MPHKDYGTPNIRITAASATYSGDVTIDGTLTYEDVTNVDAIGFITARKGINVTAGITTTPTLHVGAGIITASASGVNVTGVITATTFSGFNWHYYECSISRFYS